MKFFSVVAMIGASVVCHAGVSCASIIYDDSVPGTLTVSWDETFTITTEPTNTYLFLVVQDTFSSADGQSFLSQISSMNQVVSRNGAPAQPVQNWTGWQYRGNGASTPNYDQFDTILGLANPTSLNLSQGDTLRWIGSMTFNTNGVLRAPDLPDGSVATAYLTDDDAINSDEIFVTVNGSNTVPEPSTYLSLTGLIICVGLAGWWRKRRQAA